MTRKTRSEFDTGLVGKKFYCLEVLSEYPDKKFGCKQYLCQCDCGNTIPVPATQFTTGRKKSCGCLTNKGNPTHGKCRTGTYSSWRSMLGRCYRTTDPGYKNYGGRGISVCEKWHKFENFHADMGDRPEGMTLDRFPDQNGNYEPGNCRWATDIQQHRNIRRNRLVTFNGDTKPVSEWSELTGFGADTIAYRLNHGWSVERALTEQPKQPKKKEDSK